MASDGFWFRSSSGLRFRKLVESFKTQGFTMRGQSENPLKHFPDPSPESEEVCEILTAAGVDQEIIDKVTGIVDVLADLAYQAESSPHQMLHRLWTSCVGKPGYDKEAWRAIEQQLKTAGVIR